MKKMKLVLLGMLFLGVTGCVNETTDTNVDNEGLLIFQAYGTGGKDDGAVNRSFIELYNNTSNDINLEGYTINYTDSLEWTTFELSGQIKKQSSYLIASIEDISVGTYATINDSEVDLIIDLQMSNDYFSICLLSDNNISSSPEELESYIDLVGCDSDKGSTSFSEDSSVYGLSKQKSVRRTTLIDSNNNLNDFEIIDYRVDGNWDLYKPLSSKDGSRNPIVEFTEDDLLLEETSNTLLIYQVYGTGDNNDGAVNRSFIQLYNNSDVNVDLSKYKLYYIDDTLESWLSFDLEGEIKANTSYLILGEDKYVETNTYYGILEDEEADLIIDLEISNKIFSICLMSNEVNLNTTDNPYTLGLDSYVDMVGVGNIFCENTVAETPSKQKSIIRDTLIDTNNNSNDFTIIDYRVEGNWDLYKPN